MKSIEFARMASILWGSGYQRKAAKQLGIDKMTVNRYVRGKTRHGKVVTIKAETANKLREIWAKKSPG